MGKVKKRRKKVLQFKLVHELYWSDLFYFCLLLSVNIFSSKDCRSSSQQVHSTILTSDGKLGGSWKKSYRGRELAEEGGDVGVPGQVEIDDHKLDL